MIEYYDKLEEVDQELIKINEWQLEQIKKLYEETERKITKTLAKLGEHMPDVIKGDNNGR